MTTRSGMMVRHDIKLNLYTNSNTCSCVLERHHSKSGGGGGSNVLDNNLNYHLIVIMNYKKHITKLIGIRYD